MLFAVFRSKYGGGDIASLGYENKDLSIRRSFYHSQTTVECPVFLKISACISIYLITDIAIQ